jgi:hypothetical protein
MRRCHMRGRENIFKRQLTHVSAFNLSLVMLQLLGAGTLRELKNRALRLVFVLSYCSTAGIGLIASSNPARTQFSPIPARTSPSSHTAPQLAFRY